MKPQHHYDDENDVEEFDVEKMLAATDATISSSPSSKHASRHRRKRRIPARYNDDTPQKRLYARLAAVSFALIGCVGILGTLSTTATDLQIFTRHLRAGTRRLASCVVSMAVDEEDAAIESTFLTWESMFSPAFLQEKRTTEAGNYSSAGNYSDSANAVPSLPPNTDLAFVLSLTACPNDEVLPGVDNRHDPKQAFYDAAALLKYSICEECAELNVASSYNHTF